MALLRLTCHELKTFFGCFFAVVTRILYSEGDLAHCGICFYKSMEGTETSFQGLHFGLVPSFHEEEKLLCSYRGRSMREGE